MDPACAPGLVHDLSLIVQRPGGWLLLLLPMVAFVWLVFQAMPPFPAHKLVRKGRRP